MTDTTTNLNTSTAPLMTASTSLSHPPMTGNGEPVPVTILKPGTTTSPSTITASTATNSDASSSQQQQIIPSPLPLPATQSRALSRSPSRSRSPSKKSSRSVSPVAGVTAASSPRPNTKNLHENASDWADFDLLTRDAVKRPSKDLGEGGRDLDVFGPLGSDESERPISSSSNEMDMGIPTSSSKRSARRRSSGPNSSSSSSDHSRLSPQFGADSQVPEVTALLRLSDEKKPDTGYVLRYRETHQNLVAAAQALRATRAEELKAASDPVVSMRRLSVSAPAVGPSLSAGVSAEEERKAPDLNARIEKAIEEKVTARIDVIALGSIRAMAEGDEKSVGEFVAREKDAFKQHYHLLISSAQAGDVSQPPALASSEPASSVELVPPTIPVDEMITALEGHFKDAYGEASHPQHLPEGLTFSQVKCSYWAYLNSVIAALQTLRSADAELFDIITWLSNNLQRNASQIIGQSLHLAVRGLRVFQAQAGVLREGADATGPITFSALSAEYQERERVIVEQGLADAKRKAGDLAPVADKSASAAEGKAVEPGPQTTQAAPQVVEGEGLEARIKAFFEGLDEVQALQPDGHDSVDQARIKTTRLDADWKAFNVYLLSLPSSHLQALFHAEFQDVVLVSAAPPVSVLVKRNATDNTDNTDDTEEEPSEPVAAPTSDADGESKAQAPQQAVPGYKIAFSQVKFVISRDRQTAYDRLKTHFADAMRLLDVTNAVLEEQRNMLFKGKALDLRLQPAKPVSKAAAVEVTLSLKTEDNAVLVSPSLVTGVKEAALPPPACETSHQRAERLCTALIARRIGGEIDGAGSEKLKSLNEDEILEVAGLFNQFAQIKAEFWKVYAELMRREFMDTEGRKLRYNHDQKKFLLVAWNGESFQEMQDRELGDSLFRLRYGAVPHVLNKRVDYLLDQKQRSSLKFAHDHWKAFTLMLFASGVAVAALAFYPGFAVSGFAAFNGSLLASLAVLGPYAPLVFGAGLFLALFLACGFLTFISQWKGDPSAVNATGLFLHNFDQSFRTQVLLQQQAAAQPGAGEQKGVDMEALIEAELNKEEVASGLGKMKEWNDPSRLAWVMAVVFAVTPVVLVVSGIDILAFIPGVTASLAVLSTMPAWQLAIALLGMMAAGFLLGGVLGELLALGLARYPIANRPAPGKNSGELPDIPKTDEAVVKSESVLSAPAAVVTPAPGVSEPPKALTSPSADSSSTFSCWCFGSKGTAT